MITALADQLTEELADQLAPIRGDCAAQTAALLRQHPELRGFAGAVVILGGRSRITGEAVPGLLVPWQHHVWAVAPDGRVIDPTAAQLLPEPLCRFYEPPAPLDSLPSVTLRDRDDQLLLIGALHPLAETATDAAIAHLPPARVYLPGFLPGSASSRWQRLARRSRRSGFTAADLVGRGEPGRGFGAGPRRAIATGEVR